MLADSMGLIAIACCEVVVTFDANSVCDVVTPPLSQDKLVNRLLASATALIGVKQNRQARFGGPTLSIMVLIHSTR